MSNEDLGGKSESTATQRVQKSELPRDIFQSKILAGSKIVAYTPERRRFGNVVITTLEEIAVVWHAYACGEVLRRLNIS